MVRAAKGSTNKSSRTSGLPPTSGSADKTLAEQHHDAASTRVKPDALKAEKALQQQVQKCLRDNFSMFGEQEVHHLRVDDMTLHERMMRDMRLAAEKQKDAPKFGKVYFADLRKRYEAQSTDDSVLEVKDDTLPISPQLYAAVDASRAAVPNRDKLIQFFQMSPTALSQSELVGILLHALELKPWLGGSHTTTLLECIRYIKRFNTIERFKDEYAAFAPQVDKTLVSLFGAMKSKGFKTQQFVETYRSECELVLPLPAVEWLLQVTGSWSGHSSDIVAVVDSSSLGRKISSTQPMRTCPTQSASSSRRHWRAHWTTTAR